MCYSMNNEFHRDTKHDAAKEPEVRPETKTAEPPQPRMDVKDFKFWSFPRRRREPAAQDPVVDRTREKV